MAVIQQSDGKKRKVKGDVALSVWEVLTNRREPADEAQAKYCEQVHKVWLPWRDAPDEYVEENFDIIVQLHLGDWMCDYQGNLTRPDPSRLQAVEFAKKWGLIEHGIVTRKAKQHIAKYQIRRWQ